MQKNFINRLPNSNCNSRLILSLWLTVLIGCSGEKNNAPDRNFYFDVIAHKSDKSSTELKAYILEQIPKRKYTITNHSGMEWPFYKELELDERISKDSLMPPHWYVHRMIPFKKDQVIKPDEFFVRIDLLPQVDSIPNYSVEIFRMDSVGLKLSGQSGLHYIHSSELTTNSLREVYLKSIIRYSFK